MGMAGFDKGERCIGYDQASCGTLADCVARGKLPSTSLRLVPLPLRGRNGNVHR